MGVRMYWWGAGKRLEFETKGGAVPTTPGAVMEEPAGLLRATLLLWHCNTVLRTPMADT